MDQIAVLLPCYNESQTIGKVVDDFKRELPEAVVYVYDNNSTDGTGDVARAHGAVVRREYAQGKGNVIRRMFLEIDAACYIMADGDDTYPAEYAREMIALVRERQADMVVGDRLSSTYFEENKRPFHNIVKSFPVLSKGFEIETEMSIHAVDKNMRTENVVIHYRDRPQGSESKLNTVSDGVKVLKTIGKLFRNYKPFAFFGALALVLLALSLGFFIPVFAHYLSTGLVPNQPTLIVCGFTAIAAIQAFFSGLILETINQKNRQDFEMRLMEIHREYRRRQEERQGRP